MRVRREGCWHRLKNMVSGWGSRMHSRVPTFMENGIGSYTHVSEGREREGWETDGEKGGVTNLVHCEGHCLTAEAMDPGLAQQSRERQPPFRRPASHRQTSSRVGILWGPKASLWKPKSQWLFSFIWLFLRNHITTNILLLFPLSWPTSNLYIPYSQKSQHTSSHHPVPSTRGDSRLRQGWAAARLWHQQAWLAGSCKEPCLCGHVRGPVPALSLPILGPWGTVLMSLNFLIYKVIKATSVFRVVIEDWIVFEYM